MKDILSYKLYYFIGIGGIGMSALARYFNHYGKKVCGYDKTSTALTDQLAAEGIDCHFTEDTALLKSLLAGIDANDAIMIYTPAVPDDHAELVYLRSAGFVVYKRAAVLGKITEQFRTIAIAGTHGKTTTTTLVTHILRTAGLNCFSFMGGISKNYNTNLLLGNVRDKNSYVVVEADEYDRSFLQLRPFIEVLISIDPDHLDIYEDAENVNEAYELFIGRLDKNGLLVVKKNVDNELHPAVNKVIYSLNLDTDYRAEAVKLDSGRFTYDVETPAGSLKDVTLGVPGLHNVENSIAAVAVAQRLGIDGTLIREALRSFKGVRRRFEVRVNTQDRVYVDDYAHHPTEIKAAVSSLRQLFPSRRITGIFQPHLFSRTRDFADDFAASLDLLDECILLEIYPAREEPIAGVCSEMLTKKMKIADKKVMTKEELLTDLALNKRSVLITMGAGDIDLLAERIERIQKQN